MCLREERIVPVRMEVATRTKTHGLQYGFRIRLPLRRGFKDLSLRVVHAIRGEGIFFHRIKKRSRSWGTAAPREDLL